MSKRIKYFLIFVIGFAVAYGLIYAALKSEYLPQIGLSLLIIGILFAGWKLAGAFSYLDKTKDNDKVS